jgi:hypothetical protein
MKLLLTAILLVFSTLSFSQSTKVKQVKALFIGNSYTYFNNLPQICTGIAASMGDVFSSEQSTPGGFSLKQHSSDSSSLQPIISGPYDFTNSIEADWDYVILQEHSRFPSFPMNEVEKNVFPYASKLDSIIHKYNPNARTVFYMTWGRKNGDATGCKSGYPVCTYQEMDDQLAKRYSMMAERSKGIVSPVGAVWRYLRAKTPNIELYTKDESHPSEAGSYAAACTFYSTFFKKDPTLIKYNYTLSQGDASAIRKAVKEVVFNNLPAWDMSQ